MVHRGFLRSALYVMVFSALFGCAQTPHTDTRTPQSSIPHDFRLLLSEGGGVTGRWQGFLIHADGQVFRWQGGLARADSQQVGRLKPEQLRSLWQQIQSRQLLSAELLSPGNMSQKIEITANGKTHRLIWASNSDASPLQKQVSRLYDSWIRMIRDLE